MDTFFKCSRPSCKRFHSKATAAQCSRRYKENLPIDEHPNNVDANLCRDVLSDRDINRSSDDSDIGISSEEEAGHAPQLVPDEGDDIGYVEKSDSEGYNFRSSSSDEEDLHDGTDMEVKGFFFADLNLYIRAGLL